MRMRKIIFSIFLLIGSNNFVNGQQDISGQLAIIKQMVDEKHIQPRRIDDSFSLDWYNTFLEILDPTCLFFIKPDLDALGKYRTSLDDEIGQSKADFYKAVTALYKTRVNNANAIIQTLCSKPFDFSLKEFYVPGFDTLSARNEKELEKKWYTLLKTEVLHSLGAMAASQYSLKKSFNKSEILSKEPEVRARIKTKFLNKLKAYTQFGKSFEATLSSIYINSFLHCFDPHSIYMDGQARQSFETGMNTEGYFFGFTLVNTEKGEVAISHLEPGGPAWSSGRIHKDDVLLQMKWEGKSSMDLEGLDAEEISEMMDESNTARLEITVRKKNGLTETINLQKRKLENDENFVKSFVLKGEKKIGYITLPSFYTQWEEESGSRCANDVAKEIVKLKRDSISGLVLDLRNNGGGSM